MRRLVIGLLVLAGLAVAADFGAAALTESALSRQVRGQLRLVDDPSVRINGFPFVTQAVSGDYPSVDIDAKRVAAGPFQQLEVSAHLHDVRAPLSTLIGSDAPTVHVTAADGMVQVDAADLQRLFPELTKARIEAVDAAALRAVVANGGDPGVAALDPAKVARLIGTIDVFGHPVEIAVLLTLRLDGDSAVVAPQDVRLSDGTGLPLPGAVQRALLQQFDRPLDTGGLPFAVKPTSFGVVDGTLAISGTASNLTLD